jgi:hypothetical protein
MPQKPDFAGRLAPVFERGVRGGIRQALIENLALHSEKRGRRALIDELSWKVDPELDLILRALKALDCRLTIVAKQRPKRPRKAGV